MVIKDTHEEARDVLKFILSNGDQVSVTGNHGMLVYQDGDCTSATKRDQLVYAHQVQVGMKFRTFTRKSVQDLDDPKTDKGEPMGTIRLAEVVKIEKETTEAVYNLVGLNFNVVANNIVVSSIGEDTKGYPDFVFKVGQLIYSWIGTKAARKYYKAFE